MRTFKMILMSLMVLILGACGKPTNTVDAVTCASSPLVKEWTVSDKTNPGSFKTLKLNADCTYSYLTENNDVLETGTYTADTNLNRVRFTSYWRQNELYHYEMNGTYLDLTKVTSDIGQ